MPQYLPSAFAVEIIARAMSLRHASQILRAESTEAVQEARSAVIESRLRRAHFASRRTRKP